jgi:hypothetical protein
VSLEVGTVTFPPGPAGSEAMDDGWLTESRRGRGRGGGVDGVEGSSVLPPPRCDPREVRTAQMLHRGTPAALHGIASRFRYETLTLLPWPRSNIHLTTQSASRLHAWL